MTSAQASPRSFSRTLLLALLTISVLIIVASYEFVLLMGYGFVFFTPQGLTVSIEPFPAYFLLFFIVGFYIPIEGGAVFSFLLLLYAICFAAAWRWRTSFHHVVKRVFSHSFRGFFSNFLSAMPLVSSMLLTAVLAVIYLQDAAGVPTGTPAWPSGTPQQEIFLELSYAPFAEEIGFRLIPIGLFMILYVFLIGRSLGAGNLKLLATSLFYPEGAKRSAGLPNVGENGILRGVSKGEWAMILITSLVFGYAHVASGIGWQLGKVTSVSLQGFVFALTYIAYGFEAPILLHWFFNYYLFFFDPDIVSKFFPAADPVLSVVEILIIVLGIAGWIVFAIAGIQRLVRRPTTRQEMPVTTVPQGSP